MMKKRIQIGLSTFILLFSTITGAQSVIDSLEKDIKRYSHEYKDGLWIGKTSEKDYLENRFKSKITWAITHGDLDLLARIHEERPLRSIIHNPFKYMNNRYRCEKYNQIFSTYVENHETSYWNYTNFHPINHFIQLGCQDLAISLIDFFTDPEVPNHLQFVHRGDSKNAKTPLMTAAWYRDYKIFYHLLSKDVVTKTIHQTDKFGNSAMRHLNIRSYNITEVDKYLGAVEYVLNHFSIDTNAENKEGVTEYSWFISTISNFYPYQEFENRKNAFPKIWKKIKTIMDLFESFGTNFDGAGKNVYYLSLQGHEDAYRNIAHTFKARYFPEPPGRDTWDINLDPMAHHESRDIKGNFHFKVHPDFFEEFIIPRGACPCTYYSNQDQINRFSNMHDESGSYTTDGAFGITHRHSWVRKNPTLEWIDDH